MLGSANRNEVSTRAFGVERLVERETEAPWRFDEHNECELALVSVLAVFYRRFYCVRFVFFEDL